ncbi:hypothetical protein GOP47_0021090 [Adiantum capillus-veneris]|uniref:Fe-S cluster assembly protein SufB n=1 Tax=Adiantum capillus-veneris TaxID=13818 RepID=A0A9D4Z847_ADICA|nr:hypothetical protein GOP47_0021090 [Adiantum capillus-veneris]
MAAVASTCSLPFREPTPFPGKVASSDRTQRCSFTTTFAHDARQGSDSDPSSSSSTSSSVIQHFLKRDYKWGFVSDIESVSIPKGLSKDTIRLISAKKREPPWLLEFRLHAYKQWLKMKEPRWSDNEYPTIDFQDYCYYSEPKQKEKNKSLDEVDPALLEVF